ncbi:uncharacterized protein LOC123525125 isoform X2 [Mercenaria mercenaria]|uniref:uncharacterized protein LOC123525125 isoform X2 n=1 Tax=Mercenaria mercenaria TaxID=6596 RepID=UPI00234E84B3|nr:uncharacterized protein LOC123525125 isoform X2 [Mercenaria mercenaria]
MGESDEINKEIQESETRMNHEHHHRSMHGHNFFSLKTDSDFLIEGIKISSVQGIILAMVFTFAIAICYDSTKYMMFVQDYQTIQDKKRKKYWRLFVKVISHMLSVSLAYIMMLCIMTMNVWLMVSMLLGSGFAHFVMRPVLSRKLERRLELSTELNIEPPAEAEPFNRHNNRKKNENSEM